MALIINHKYLLIFWLFGVACVFTALLLATGTLGVFRLSKEGVSTTAVITSYDPNVHCTVEYAFSVASRRFSGSGSLCAAQVGGSTSITYLASDPTKSCLGKADDSLLNNLIPIFMASLFVPTLFLFSLFRKRKTLFA
jgi:hypothetical protein